MARTDAGRDLIAGLIAGTGNALNASNARIGVGDSSTAFAASQTDLQAATNKFRKIVDSAPGVAANVLTFIATFASGEANFTWAEFGLFNSSSGATMLTRKVAAHGTKASGDVWTMTVVVTVT